MKKNSFINKILKTIVNKLIYYIFIFKINTSKLLKNQVANPLSIPIIIINFNQLYYLQQLVDFFIKRGHHNIVIIDNNSTYQPLIDYYSSIENNVTIERMCQNFGHMVFFESNELQNKYGKGFYFLTDADIIPNNQLPLDFFETMLQTMKKHFVNITKVGFALDIESIPDYYPKKQNVINWETPFWKYQAGKNKFHSLIDTTFALYKPGYPKKYKQVGFLYAIRMSGNFTAKHGGWYIDYNNMTEEQVFFQKTATSSSSWMINNQGEFNFDLSNKHYD